MTLFFMRGPRVMRVSGFGRHTESPAAQPVFETEGLIDYAVAHRSERFAVLTRDRAERVDAQVITDWLSLIPAAPR
jgi:hypothetical protein